MTKINYEPRDSKYSRWGNEGPKWFDWTQWGFGLGSDQRYRPRWWERRAYYKGLRDAARMVEAQRYMDDPEKPGRARVMCAGSMELRRSVRELHKFVREFMGLPPNHKSGLE